VIIAGFLRPNITVTILPTSQVVLRRRASLASLQTLQYRALEDDCLLPPTEKLYARHSLQE